MIIKTYEELKFYLNMFKNGNANLLVISSRGGLGKSKLITEVLENMEYIKILAHVTPLRLYSLCYEHKDKAIIIDDVDSLMENTDNIALIKQLCESSEVKEMSWLSTTSTLDKIDLPEVFTTSSKAIIICNSFNELSYKISAVRDRAFNLEFIPNKQEILNKMIEILPKIFLDMPQNHKEEVLTLIKEYSNVADISLRSLVKGLSLYKECNSGKALDWKSRLIASLEIMPKPFVNNQEQAHSGLAPLS
jgi:hypothetical protein